DDRRPACGGETPAVDRRKVLANGVHFLDRGAAAQELARYGLELLHGDVGRGKRKQARAAAGEKGEEKIVGLKLFCLFQNLPCRGLAGFVGDRMAGLDDADLAGGQPVTVARDGNAFELAAVALLHRERHRGCGLACGRDEGAAPRRRGKVRGEDMQRIGRRDRGTQAFLEQPPHQAGAKLSFAASGPRLKYFGYVSLKTRLISSAGTSP